MELEELIVSGAELDKRLVTEILAPYIKLDKDTCKIRPTDKWGLLSNDEKILIYLIARKAMVALENFDLSVEGALANEVISDTGVKSGTAYPALRKLLSSRLIEQSRDKRYYVPNYSIPQIKDILSGKKEKG